MSDSNDLTGDGNGRSMFARLRAWTSNQPSAPPVEELSVSEPLDVEVPSTSPRWMTPVSQMALGAGSHPRGDTRGLAAISHPESAVDTSRDVAFRFRFRGDRVMCEYVSAAVEPVLGLSVEALRADGAAFFRRCVPEDRDAVRGAFTGASSGRFVARFRDGAGAPQTLEFRYAREQGRRDVWLHGFARAVDETDGVEEAYKLALEGAGLGLFEWSVSSDTIRLSGIASRVLGLAAAGVYSSNVWFRRVHPDDSARVAAKFTLHVRNHHRPFADEHRILALDGRTLWVRATGIVVQDERLGDRMVGTIADVTVRKREELALRRAASHDALTGLVNRAALLQRFEQACDREAFPRCAVLCAGLDRFKKLNDGLGQARADSLLLELATRLRTWAESSHATVQGAGDVTLARLGGDEFAFLFEDVRNGEQLESLARHILALVATPVTVDGKPVVVTASVGVATTFDGETRPSRVVENAQSAMYRAKSRGRARYVYYSSLRRDDAFDAVRLESDLRLAIRRGELYFCYQPLIDLRTGTLVGVEALMRWDHPERGAISPSQFIPIAEQTDLAIEIGEWTLDTVCAQIAAWEALGLPEGFAVNVNLSSAHFAQTTLPARIATTLRRLHLDGARLKLEITESALMAEPDAAVGVLTAIKELGVRICVDDFGTGYSSLSQLNRLPIDVLKIDKAFVTALDPRRGVPSDALARSIIALAESLDLEVVAEGIETPQVRDRVAELGCHVGQGYLFSRPVPAGDVDEWLEYGPDRCFEITQNLPAVADS